jgi:asparagine synthase (glutamine-hydrolysing)
MCGFTGFLADSRFDRARLAPTAQAMADAIRHRGPDDSGVWTDAQAGIALGHRRLSIIDLSPAGHQPMASASGRFVIVYNGEIYNFATLRAELEAQGSAPPWRGRSDTEVLLALIEARGVRAALQAVRGMFAFALWDTRDRTLVLARDRLGEKPLYYGRVGGSFAFGSELKALRAHPAWNAPVDRGALALFMRHSYVPSPYTIHEGIRKLQPGQMLTLARGTRDPVVEPYWSAREAAESGFRSPMTMSQAALTDSLDALLRDAIAGQMVADVPLGAFLSGGIDSSVVVALMQAQSTRPVKTFTIGFTEEGYDEAVHAAAVARHLGTEHTELYVTPREAMAVIPRLPSIYDEPFADSSQIPTFLVSQLARAHVTVSLSGDGGDELFGGYNRYLLGKDLWQKLSRLPTGVRSAFARLFKAIPPRTWPTLMKPFMPFAPGRYRVGLPGDKLYKLADVVAHADLDSLYRDIVSHWRSPGEIVLGGAEHPTLLSQAGDLPIDDPVARMMFLDLVTYMPDDILVKVDRAAMAVSLESRVPLLDHRLVEFAWQVPMMEKVNARGTKQLLRSVLRRYVPDELIDRPKMGFGVPIDRWLRGPLRDWAEALLDPARLRREGYFDPGPIRASWQQHLSGQRDWHYQLWDVLIFQAWLEHVDGQ